MDSLTMRLEENWKFHLGEAEDAWYKGYDDSSWRDVVIPHDWSVEQPFSQEYSSGTGYLAGGTGWYRVRFTLPEEYRGKKIGYLFQSFELLDNLTGRENILLPLSLHGVPAKESRERLQSLSDYLEITDVLDKFPAQMSGGQQQRIAAARALILRPDIVLADEPTGALDSGNAKSLMEKLSGLNQEHNTTILMVTHDANAASYCKRILFIQDGVIFHELRKNVPEESRPEFYERILKVMAQLGGGSANVL